MVKSESDLLGNLVKIRFTGIPVAQAIKSIAIENSEISVKDLHQEAENQFNLNPLLNYKYIYKGKVLSDFTKIAELNLRPSDVITVMAEQAGAGSFTTNQFKLFTELYRIINPKSKGADIDIQKIGDLLQRTLKLRKDFVRDLTNYPRDLNVMLKLLYHFETKIKDKSKISQVRATIENFIIENNILFESTEQTRKLLRIYSQTTFLISDIEGEFTSFGDLGTKYLKEKSIHSIERKIEGEEHFGSKDWKELRWLVLRYKHRNPALASEILNTLNNPEYLLLYKIDTKGKIVHIFPYSKNDPDQFGARNLKYLVSDNLRKSEISILKELKLKNMPDLSNKIGWSQFADSIREHNEWGEWKINGPNVAIIKFNLKFKNGLSQSGYIFAKSGEQFMADTVTHDGEGFVIDWSYFNLKYLAQKVDYYRWFDAERKAIISLESSFSLEDVVEGDFTIASEKEFCDSCNPIIELITKILHNKNVIVNTINGFR